MKDEIEAAVAGATAHLSATAARRGRNPALPWVPIVVSDWTTATGEHHFQTQVRAKAFRTREQALVYAERVIESRRSWYRQAFADPNMRALRAKYKIED